MVSVLVPVYNEARSVRATIEGIRDSLTRAGVTHEIVTVDDASTDDTPKVLAALTGVHVIRHPENLGYGASLKTGIRAAKGEVLGIIDADGTYPADAFPALLSELVEGVDMVVGVRSGRGDAFPLLRRPGKIVVRALAAFLVGKRIPDLNSGMRVMRRALYERFAHLLPDGFSFTTTVTLGALTNHCGVRWVPVKYAPRVSPSSITFRRGVFREFPAFLTLIVRIVTYFKPLRFFAVPSFVFLALGVGNLVYTLVTQGNVTDASILLIVVGIQIGLMGLVADLVVRSRASAI